MSRQGSMNTIVLEEDSKCEEFSSPRRKLMLAKRQDEIIDRDTKAAEAQQVTKRVSENLWERTIQSAMKSVESRQDLRAPEGVSPVVNKRKEK